MKTVEHITGNQQGGVSQMPFSTLVREGASRKDRLVQEVMEALFARLPDKAEAYDFVLADGTGCSIKKFHPPRKDEGDGLIYGFDVKLTAGAALAHLEFSVRCSGWERAI